MGLTRVIPGTPPSTATIDPDQLNDAVNAALLARRYVVTRSTGRMLVQKSNGDLLEVRG